MISGNNIEAAVERWTEYVSALSESDPSDPAWVTKLDEILQIDDPTLGVAVAAFVQSLAHDQSDEYRAGMRFGYAAGFQQGVIADRLADSG